MRTLHCRYVWLYKNTSGTSLHIFDYIIYSHFLLIRYYVSLTINAICIKIYIYTQHQLMDHFNHIFLSFNGLNQPWKVHGLCQDLKILRTFSWTFGSNYFSPLPRIVECTNEETNSLWPTSLSKYIFPRESRLYDGEH